MGMISLTEKSHGEPRFFRPFGDGNLSNEVWPIEDGMGIHLMTSVSFKVFLIN
jgi:hypothetical protein